MSRYIIIILFIFVISPFWGNVKADVKNTLHNLGTTGPGTFVSTDESQICIFCHTPHNAVVDVPLWNHYSTTAKTFTMYSSHTTESPTGSNSNLPSDSVSRLCLSCHEGTTALGSLVNSSASLGHNPTFAVGTRSFSDAAGAVEGKDAWIGTDLTMTHPIGFDYDAVQALDSDIIAIATVKNAGLRFYGPNEDLLECQTCHDPHIEYSDTDGLKPFLRKSNKSSNLCLTCHDK